MRASTLFPLLVAVQAAHSVEEIVFGLYTEFPPAMLVARLLSSDLRSGFILGNALIVAFGIACYTWPVRRQWPSARTLMWGWASVELVNGIAHPLRSLIVGRYTAGAVTALGLLLVAVLLVQALRTMASGGDAPVASTGSRR